MTPEEVRQVMSRIDGIWPPRKPASHEERAEWVRFLKPLDGPVALRAVDGVRENALWRPSMAEFRSAYWQAAAEPDEEVLLLTGDTSAKSPELTDIYGHRRDQWVYCWRCDQAISLADQETMLYDEVRGLCHKNCPVAGSAPRIPTKLLLERNEYWRKARIAKEG